MKIAVCGGGTGGHYYPALAFIKGIAGRYPVDILYFTVKDKLEDKKIEKDFPGVEKFSLDIRGLIRPLYHPKNFIVVHNHRKKINEIKRKLKEFSPDFIFSTGGYISYPVIKAANSLNRKIFIHSQNAKPGLSNKKLSKYAHNVFISFEESKKYFLLSEEKIIYTGIPIRKCIPDREKKLNELKFSDSKPVILVVGGSFGSPIINDTMIKVYEKGSKGINYIHVTGNSKISEELKKYDFVRNFDYIDNLHEYIAVVDGVVSSGGASSIAELKYYNVPGIIIPKKYAAENHQYYNGKSLEKYGLGYVILEDELNERNLTLKIEKILSLKHPEIDNYRDPVDIMIDAIEREVEF